MTGEVVEETPGDAKGQAAEVLLDRVRADAHPSIHQMDMLERMLPRERLPEYLAILTEKVKNDPYPSTEMLERVERLSKS